MKTKQPKVTIVKALRVAGHSLAIHDGVIYLNDADNVRDAIDKGEDVDGYKLEDMQQCSVADAKTLVKVAVELDKLEKQIAALKAKENAASKPIDGINMFGESVDFWPDGDEDGDGDKEGSRISIGCTTLAVDEIAQLLKKI